MFLYYRASIAVLVQLIEERLKIPSVEPSIERSSELRLRWMVDEVGAVVQVI